MRRLIPLLPLLLVVLAAAPSPASPGGIDTSFGAGGKVLTDVGGPDDEGWTAAVQPDGKILVAGTARVPSPSYDFALVRYRADGTLDTSFSGDGMTTTDFGAYEEAHGIALQPDGKIVLTGLSDTAQGGRIAVARYNPGGSPDATFNGDGKLVSNFTANSIDYAEDIVLQPSGRIVVGGASYAGGQYDFALAAYTPSGALDTTFGGGDGLVRTDFGSSLDDSIEDLAVDAAGNVVAGGDSGKKWALARYTPDGVLDGTFGGGDGLVTTGIGGDYPTIDAMTIQPSGRIVAGGETGDPIVERFHLAGYTNDGTIDTTFGTNGFTETAVGPSTDLIHDITQQADGKILVAGETFIGNTFDMAVARYGTDGDLDPSFAGDGTVTVRFGPSDEGAYAIVIPAPGRILLAGYAYSQNEKADIALAALDESPVPNNPDALIKAGTANIGNGIYNLTGESQSAAVKAKKGTLVNFQTRLQNDGNAADTFTLRGPGDSPGFKVRYFAGTPDTGANITAQVIAGTYVSPSVAAGATSAPYSIQVQVLAKAKVGARKTWLLTASSGADAGRADATKGTVSVIKS